MLPRGEESSSVVLLEAKILLREDWIGGDIDDACSYTVLWTLGKIGVGLLLFEALQRMDSRGSWY